MPLNKLHGDIEQPINLAIAIEADDVGVFELGDRFRFTHEAGAIAVFFAIGGVDDFDGDLAAESAVGCFVDAGHATPAEEAMQVVFVELLSNEGIFHSEEEALDEWVGLGWMEGLRFFCSDLFEIMDKAIEAGDIGI